MRQGEPENVTEQALNTPCHMQPQRMCNTRNRLNNDYGFTHVHSLLSNGMAPKQIKIHRFQCCRCCCCSSSSFSSSSLPIRIVNKFNAFLFVADEKWTNQYQSIAINSFLTGKIIKKNIIWEFVTSQQFNLLHAVTMNIDWMTFTEHLKNGIHCVVNSTIVGIITIIAIRIRLWQNFQCQKKYFQFSLQKKSFLIKFAIQRRFPFPVDYETIDLARRLWFMSFPVHIAIERTLAHKLNLSCHLTISFWLSNHFIGA